MADQSKGMSDLWRRLRFVFLAIVVYRMGTHIPIPGIDPARLAALFDQNQGTILEMFNLFSGGALERMSIFALNVVPYISAAIIMQLFFEFYSLLTRVKKRWPSWQESNNTIHKIWNSCLGFCSGFCIKCYSWC
jgi:preprotein translocase subunit SecY